MWHAAKLTSHASFELEGQEKQVLHRRGAVISRGKKQKREPKLNKRVRDGGEMTISASKTNF